MRLIHGDCIEEMQKLIDEGIHVDLILTDPPYGTIKGASLDGWGESTTEWDIQLPTEEMFNCCEKLLRRNSNLILFSQEPYTSYLRQYKPENLPFLYPFYWIKDHFANCLLSKKAPVSYVEDVSLFRKRYDSDITHPLREYSKELLNEIGISKAELVREIGGKADHFFRSDTSQFDLCTEETYNELIDVYSIDKFDCFKPYSELIEINTNAKLEPVFNLPENEKYKSNVLRYKKSYNHYHPTEKPVDLLEDLILTYTNKGDIVLDFTMGSGSTGVACRHTGRDFIGIELNKKYFDISVERINNYQARLI